MLVIIGILKKFCPVNNNSTAIRDNDDFPPYMLIQLLDLFCLQGSMPLVVFQIDPSTFPSYAINNIFPSPRPSFSSTDLPPLTVRQTRRRGWEAALILLSWRLTGWHVLSKVRQANWFVHILEWAIRPHNYWTKTIPVSLPLSSLSLCLAVGGW